ncbi:hypothetical protein FRC03_002272, partial [Tulasnella sp. 419]
KAVDGTPVPFVKGVAGAAIEVIKIARAIQSNKEECDDLIKRSTSLLVVILGSFDGKREDEIPEDLKKTVEQLNMSFQEILSDLRTIDNRAGKRSAAGLAKAILYHYDNQDKLKSCSTRLDWAIGEFQVKSKVDSCLKDLQRHEELRKGQEAIREDLREGKVEAQLKLQEISDRQTEIRERIQVSQVEIRDGLIEIRDVMKGQMILSVLSNNLPSTVMPADPKIFGRQEYVEKAVLLLLANDTARLAILGPGGMGKTSVALKIIHAPRVKEKYGSNRYWVPCEQATSVLLFIELIAKSLDLPPSSSGDRFGEIVALLENSGQLHIFLLDNFETPWDLEGQQSDIADVLTRLASIPSVSLIITMRGTQYPSSNTIDWSTPRLPSLAQLELDAAEEAFLRISPDATNNPELKTLLKKLDCMPLAITLMAKLSEAGETISELLSQWGTERTVLSPIQSYVLRHHPLEQGPLGDLRASYYKLVPGENNDPDFDIAANLLIVAQEEANIEALLINAFHHEMGDGERAIRASLAFTDLLYSKQPRTEAIAEAARMARARSSPLLAQCLYQYAIVLRAQGREDAALPILEDAKSEFTKMGESAVVARCQNLIAEIMCTRGQHVEARAMLQEARNTLLELGQSDFAAWCLWSIGQSHLVNDEFDLAYAAYKQARSEFISTGNRWGSARCLMHNAVVDGKMGKSDAAQAALKDAMAEFVDLEQPSNVAACLYYLGEILPQPADALAKYEEALAIYTQLGNIVWIQDCRENVDRIRRILDAK